MSVSVYPKGTTIHNKKKSYQSYTLFDGRDGQTYLIDMEGNLIHVWPYSGFPVEMINPALNSGRKGDILCQQGSDMYLCENLLIVDWMGNNFTKDEFYQLITFPNIKETVNQKILKVIAKREESENKKIEAHV